MGRVRTSPTINSQCLVHYRSPPVDDLSAEIIHSSGMLCKRTPSGGRLSKCQSSRQEGKRRFHPRERVQSVFHGSRVIKLSTHSPFLLVFLLLCPQHLIQWPNFNDSEPTRSPEGWASSPFITNKKVTWRDLQFLAMVQEGTRQHFWVFSLHLFVDHRDHRFLNRCGEAPISSLITIHSLHV